MSGSPRNRAGAVLSGMFFLLAAGLFTFVLWNTVGPGASHGEWRSVSDEIRLGDLRLSGPDDRSGDVEHPALIYFHDPECSPCRPASQRFRERVANGSTEAGAAERSYYVIGKPGAFAPDSAVTEFPPPVEVFVPVGSNPSLGFVRDLPMFVATDSTGRVAEAYVGTPDSDVFERLESAGNESLR